MPIRNFLIRRFCGTYAVTRRTAIYDFLSVGFQVSVFSVAAGLKSGQFDQKTDSSVAESDTRICYTASILPRLKLH